MEIANVKPRKIARAMARAQLDKAKITGYNNERFGLNGRKQPSMFSQNWKKLAAKAQAEAAQREKARKKGARKA